MTEIAPPSPSSQGGNPLPSVEDAARAQFAALALACVGLSAAPATLAAYLDAVMWSVVDRASAMARAAFAAMSSCALFMLRLFDRAGIQHAILQAPYVDQMAPHDVETILAFCKASRGRYYRPKLGDVVVIESPWHVCIITKVDGDRYETTQGGERDGQRFECIATVVRWYRLTPSGPCFDTRPIVDVGDCVALSAAGSAW